MEDFHRVASACGTISGMNMGGKSGSAKESVEHQIGIQVEQVDLGEFLASKPSLEKLRYNVLTDSEEDNLAKKITEGERRQELTPVRGGLRGSPDKEAVFVAKENGKAIGLLVVNFDGGDAVIQHFWSAKPEGAQHDVVKALVAKAQSDLPSRAEHSYAHLYIPLTTGAKVSNRLTHIAANPTVSNFLRFRKAASDNDPGERYQREAA